jgi:hypothetical protein
MKGFDPVDERDQRRPFGIPRTQRGEQRLALGPFGAVLAQAVAPPGEAQLHHDRIAPVARGIGQALFKREIPDPQRTGCGRA